MFKQIDQQPDCEYQGLQLWILAALALYKSFIIPLKNAIIFFTQSLGLSVCLSVCACVCHQNCDEMAGLRNTVLSEAITPDNS